MDLISIPLPQLPSSRPLNPGIIGTSSYIWVGFTVSNIFEFSYEHTLLLYWDKEKDLRKAPLEKYLCSSDISAQQAGWQLPDSPAGSSNMTQLREPQTSLMEPLPEGTRKTGKALRGCQPLQTFSHTHLKVFLVLLALQVGCSRHKVIQHAVGRQDSFWSDGYRNKIKQNKIKCVSIGNTVSLCV